MSDSQEKKQKRIKKLLEVAVKGEEAILESIFELEDKLEEIVPEKGDKGDKGDSYELTDEDKQEIASLIEAPVVEKVVEKIIEKTEVIKEQPIINEITKVTNEIKEVAKSDTPEQIVDKINSTEKSIEFKVLKNYPDYSEEIKRLKSIINSTPAITTSFINGTRAKNIDFSGASVSYNGDTARVIIPTTDLSGYVPYTGATSDVDLGINGLTANDLNISGQTASRIASFDASKNVVALDTATYPSLTELSYVKGVTSAIQTQINAKFTLPSLTSGSILFSDGSTIAQDNSNFFWDNTNKQLEIGSDSIVHANSLNPIAIAKTSISYLATYIQNLSSGTAASTDLIIGNNADDGTVSTGTYLDMGINSSGYTGSGLTNGAGDAYIFNNLEDLIIGTATAGKNVIIGTNIFGGTAASKTRATFTDTGLQMMNGSASAPSISGTGATTTGFYWAATPSILTSIAGVNRLTHSATTWSLNSSNGGTLDIGGTSQYMDFGGTVVAGAATFQALRTTGLIWDMQTSRTNSFGMNNANTIGGSTAALALTTMSANRSGNVLTGSIGITITTSSAFEAREFNNGSSGTVAVTNNWAFNASQNMATGGTLNGSFRGVNTAAATRWNLYMEGTAQNWLEGSTGIGINIPTAKLHVVQGSLGTNALTVSSTATNDDPTTHIPQQRVTTTNATQTTLYTLQTATNTSYNCQFRVIARRTGGAGGAAGDYATYVVDASVNNIAGTVTIDAVTTTVGFESQAGWDVTVTASGTTALLRVTGAASNNITWHLSWSLISPLST